MFLSRLCLVLPVLALVLPPQQRGRSARAAEAAGEEVRFEGFGGLELVGTLLLPAGGEGPLPAALLVPGSGPTNRDGNQPFLATNLLKQIAERLAEEGIASLRFDKRAVASYAPDWPETTAEQDRFFAWEAFAGDVAAAHVYLRARPEVDAARVAIVGHSEGGLLALQVAQDLPEEDRPAALVLAATAGRKLDVVIREQVSLAFGMAGLGKREHARYMEALDAAIAAVLAEEPLPELPEELAPIFPANARSLLFSYFTLDALELAARYGGPVLVLQGEKDAQVSAERDAPRLAEALRAREGARMELVLVPGASHSLKRTRGFLDPGIVGPVLPKAMDGLADFLREELRPAAASRGRGRR